MISLERNYRPVVAGQRVQLMRGDFHRHTEISFDGKLDGPLVDTYRYAIDAAGLDWIGCCDHDNGGAREYDWWLEQKYNDAYLLGSALCAGVQLRAQRELSRGTPQRAVRATRRPASPACRSSATLTPAPAPDTAMLYQYLASTSTA